MYTLLGAKDKINTSNVMSPVNQNAQNNLMLFNQWKQKFSIKFGVRLGLIFLLLGIGLLTYGQKALQFEKGGSLKTNKFFEGDVLVYKLKNDQKHWLSERISKIHMEDKLIQFENRAVFIDSIYAIQLGRGGKFARPMSTALKTFSGIWGFWTLVSLAYGEKLTWPKIIVGGGSYLIGWLLQQTFYKTHKIKGRKRLRLVDLTFYGN